MDTQIGTRPQIGALEIHQAYILASLNWLQQTRSLEMNHVAIEKAEKYMNNLETFKCYNFFSQNFPGCIILKEEDFINLNVKYGLVSGPLSYYKGDIPEDNLDEILATKTTLDSLTDRIPYYGYGGFNSILNKTTNLINMERELYNWLEREFYKSNHTKYHRYFKEWITNICPHQVEGFRNQMIGQLTKSKVK